MASLLASFDFGTIIPNLLISIMASVAAIPIGWWLFCTCWPDAYRRKLNKANAIFAEALRKQKLADQSSLALSIFRKKLTAILVDRDRALQSAIENEARAAQLLLENAKLREEKLALERALEVKAEDFSKLTRDVSSLLYKKDKEVSQKDALV